MSPNQEARSSRLRFDAEVVFVLVLTLFFSVFFAKSLGFRGLSAPYPRFVSGVGLALSLYLLAGKLHVEGVNGEIRRSAKAGDGIAWYWWMGLLWCYLGLMWVLGFAVSTFLSLIATGRLLGERRWAVLVVYGAASTLLARLVFSRLLYVPLPTGLLSLW